MMGIRSTLDCLAMIALQRRRPTLPCLLFAPLMTIALLFAPAVVWGADKNPMVQRAIEGPFRAQAMNFYFVHTGGPLVLQFRATADEGNEMGRVVYRFFDREENLVRWDYQRMAPGETLVVKHDFGVEAPAGIYQVRYAGRRIGVEAESEPQRPFGLAASRTMVSMAKKEQFKSLWFQVPPDACMVTFQGIGLGGVVRDEAGKIVSRFRHESPAESSMVNYRGQLLNLSVHGGRPGDYYRFGVLGMTPIYTADPQTARAIGINRHQASDGRLFPHRFQVLMHEWIRALRREDLELDPMDLRAYEKEWLDRPEAASALLGPWGLFSAISYLIRDMDIDSKSEAFGRSATRENPAAMAAVVGLQERFNPYYGNRALQNRVLLQVFKDLLEMRETDTWSDSDSSYSGGDALRSDQRFTALYFGRDAIEDRQLFELWVEGLSRLLHRFPFFHVSAENQSSHWPVMLYKTYLVTGEDAYRRLAQDFIGEMTTGRFMDTGYQQEAYGPDATYQGLGAANQALYYRMSGDVTARAGLRTIYDFFNHTVAPDPDGRVFGASGFSHRTQGSWVSAQYGGGFTYMAGELPEAAVWVPGKPPILTPRDIVRELGGRSDGQFERSPQILAYTTHVIGPFLRYYRFPSMPIPGARLPVEAKESFTRNFNGEFLAVRRPSYYFLGYTKRTADHWVKSRRRVEPGNSHDNNKWNEMLGPQIFWTPEYGNAVLSMNWNGGTHHMVRVDRNDGTVSFPDNWDSEVRVREEEDLLVLEHGLVDLPARVERRIRFHPEAVEHTVTLTAAESIQVLALYEQIPLHRNKEGFELRFHRNGAWRTEPGVADAFWCGDGEGNGVLFSVNRPLEMSVGEESVFRSGQRVLPVRLHLAPSLKAGAIVSFRLTMRGFSRENLWRCSVTSD